MRYLVMIIIGAIAAFYGFSLLSDTVNSGYNYLNKDQGAKMSGTLLLIVIGMTLFIYGIVHFFKKQSTDKLKNKYRMQPLMWRKDWSNAKSYSNVGVKVHSLIFGLIWTAAVVPLMLAIGPEFKKEAPLPIYWIFTIGFPATGILVILSSFKHWIKFFIIGKTPLNLLNLPGNQGQDYEITLGVPLKNKEIKWECEILCLYNFIKKRRRNNSTEYTQVRDELWKKNMDIEIIRGRKGEMISAKTTLADKLPDTGKRKKGDIDWVVDVIGTNKKGKKVFEREFIVPVFSGAKDANIKDNSVSYASSRIDKTIEEKELQEIEDARNMSSFSENDSKFNENKALNKLSDLGIFVSNEGIKYTDKAWSKAFGKIFAKYAIFVMLILNVVPVIIIYNIEIKGAFDILPIIMISIFQLIMIIFTILLLFMKVNKYEIKFKDDSIIKENICFGRTWIQSILTNDIKDIIITVSGSSSGSANGRTKNYMSVQIEPAKPKSVITKYKSKVWIHDRGFSISPSFEDREVVSSIVELVKLKINLP